MPDPILDREFAVPAMRALFQRRVEGDEALLRLAKLRFREAGLAAEVYAHTSAELDRILHFVPLEHGLPSVHMRRDLDLMTHSGQMVVEEFAAKFSGRVSGLVVHDTAQMANRLPEFVALMRQFSSQLQAIPECPTVFVEYAAGTEPERFIDLGRQLQNLDHMSVCIDSGHIGIRQAHSFFAAENPGLELRDYQNDHTGLRHVVEDVQRAVESALPTVLDMTRALTAPGKTLHFHLHDGHPLIPGLPDHFSFLRRLPVRFTYQGRRSLDPLYGPTGLAAILTTATQAALENQGRTSFTLEIHQADGRLPLADAAPLFRNWPDRTNAERMNYWLSVLSENSILATAALRAALTDAVPAHA